MMKKTLSFFSVLVLMGCASVPTNENEINQKLDAKTDKEIVLVKAVDDSRCPEGVQCIWAGEVTIEVAAYENKKLVEQTQFVVNRNTKEEINAWFTKHLPLRKEPLKEINVLPYPKEGVQVKKEDYKIKLEY
jgi:hypothetical protein